MVKYFFEIWSPFGPQWYNSYGIFLVDRGLNVEQALCQWICQILTTKILELSRIRRERKLGRKLFCDLMEIFNILVKTRSHIEHLLMFNYY